MALPLVLQGAEFWLGLEPVTLDVRLSSPVVHLRLWSGCLSPLPNLELSSQSEPLQEELFPPPPATQTFSEEGPAGGPPFLSFEQWGQLLWYLPATSRPRAKGDDEPLDMPPPSCSHGAEVKLATLGVGCVN